MSDASDANQEAHRVASEAVGGLDQENTPPELEAAWEAWSKQIKQVDRRGMELLRAAFEAGWSGGASRGAAAMGKAGGLKGGKARADKLSSAERSDIARKAAEARWKNSQ
ncbi:MAG: hypothetical protein AAGF84_04925 [Planctomycetota bacterium]